jgi:hypothetical protein
MPKASTTNPPDTFMTGAAAPADGAEVAPVVGVEAAWVVWTARVVDALVYVDEDEPLVVELELLEEVIDVDDADDADVDVDDDEAWLVEVAEAEEETVFVDEMENCGV